MAENKDDLALTSLQPSRNSTNIFPVDRRVGCVHRICPRQKLMYFTRHWGPKLGVRNNFLTFFKRYQHRYANDAVPYTEVNTQNRMDNLEEFAFGRLQEQQEDELTRYKKIHLSLRTNNKDFCRMNWWFPKQTRLCRVVLHGFRHFIDSCDVSQTRARFQWYLPKPKYLFNLIQYQIDNYRREEQIKYGCC